LKESLTAMSQQQNTNPQTATAENSTQIPLTEAEQAFNKQVKDLLVDPMMRLAVHVQTDMKERQLPVSLKKSDKIY
jgi:hypothetical protein